MSIAYSQHDFNKHIDQRRAPQQLPSPCLEQGAASTISAKLKFLGLSQAFG